MPVDLWAVSEIGFGALIIFVVGYLLGAYQVRPPAPPRPEPRSPSWVRRADVALSILLKVREAKGDGEVQWIVDQARRALNPDGPTPEAR